MKTTKYYATRNDLLEDIPIFDTYVVGSDQVWNERHMKGAPTFLLDFVPDEKKKISYASSAARAKISDNLIDRYRKLLKRFSAISVRETNTQRIVKDLTGVMPIVTLDPTLLLTNEEWTWIADVSTFNVNEPYILVYILKYSFHPYPYATELIRTLYKETGYRIVMLRYSAREHLGIDNVIDLHESVGPCEFVSLFKNAAFVVTTSFHGTAFAINFERPFYSLINKDIEDDRISSLLELLGCDDRGVDYRDVSKCHFGKLDYENIKIRLNKERQKSMNYLKENLQ